MAAVGDVQNHHARGRGTGIEVRSRSTAGDVWVHAASGKLFAQLVDHQNVERLQEQPGHVVLGLGQQLPFGLNDLLGGNRRDFRYPVVGVFHASDAKQDGKLGQLNFGHFHAELGHAPEAEHMGGVGAFLFAKADGDHLHQAALVGTAESVVRLDAIDHDNAVGLVGMLVHQHRKAVIQNAEFDDVHGGNNRAAGARFGHSQIRPAPASALRR